MRHTQMRASILLITAALLAGCPAPITPAPPLPPAPQVLSFGATPSQVSAGESVTLAWDTRHASSVTIWEAATGVVSGVTGGTGEVVVSVEQDALFVLTARNEAGAEVSIASAVEVDEPAPEALFVVNPQVIDLGGTTTLAWSAPGARTVSLAEKDGPAVDIGTQLQIGAISLTPARSTTYVLTVDGLAHEATVQVRPKVGALVATPSSALPGEELTISWQTSGAFEVTLSLAGGEVLHTETEPASVADGSFTYQVPASTSPSAVLSFVVTAVGAEGLGAAEKELTVYVAGEPAVREFKAPSYSLQGSNFEVSWKTSGADQVELVQDGTVVYRSPTHELADVGTATFPTPVQDSVLVLRAVNLRGGVDESDPLTVRPVGLPTVTTFTATPQPGIAQGGDPVTITWSVPNARRLKITAEGFYTVVEASGPTAESGSVVVYPNVDTTYRLEADNTIGDRITPETRLVTVTTPAGLVLTPSTAPMGGQVTVTSHTVAGGGAVTGLPVVQANVSGNGFVDISTTGVDIDFCCGDLGARQVNLPEPFSTRLFGNPITSTVFTVSINGWMHFGTSSIAFEIPLPLPNTYLPANAIAPFFEDLMDSGPDAEIYYRVDSVGGDRRLIVQWNKVEFDPIDGSQLTFQAQIFESGKIVYAYDSVQAAVGATPVIGVQDASRTGALSAPSELPADGSSFTLFGPVTLPETFTVTGGTLDVRVAIGTNHFIAIQQAFPVIPSNQFAITEANLAPTVPGGQWIELTNKTTNPIDLQNWVIDNGAGGSHTINQSLILPANGRLVLAQSPSAGDGVTVDYVYGNGLSLPATPGSQLSVGIHGAKYTALKVPATLLAGVALQVGPVSTQPYVLKTLNLTELTCTAPSTAVYGTNGQKGTPGLLNGPCPTYSYAGMSATGAFEPIAATGTPIVPSRGFNESIDAIQLSVPVRFGGLSFDKLWVGTNGFVAFRPVLCPSSTDCYAFNEGGPKAPLGAYGLAAPFWDDLTANLAGGMYWQRKVPGVTPNDGYTIVSWEDFRANFTGNTSNLNFQVKFFDNGNIEYHYGSMTSSGSGPNFAKGGAATTWLEDPSGLVALKVNVNSATSPGITAGAAYRFIMQ